MDAVIFDMDGTLTDVSSVRHLVSRENKKRDFPAFHTAATTTCPENADVAAAARMYSEAGVAVLLVSGRSDTFLPASLEWCDARGIPYDAAWFRSEGDYRPDYVVKAEILEQIVIAGYNVIEAWDDNPAVVRLWEEREIPVVVVPGWEETS